MWQHFDFSSVFAKVLFTHKHMVCSVQLGWSACESHKMENYKLKRLTTIAHHMADLRKKTPQRFVISFWQLFVKHQCYTWLTNYHAGFCGLSRSTLVFNQGLCLRSDAKCAIICILSSDSVLVCTTDVGASIFENSIVSFKNRKCVIIFLLYDWRGFFGASIKSCQPWKKISSPIELKENFHGSPITTAIWLQQGQKWFIFWNVF